MCVGDLLRLCAEGKSNKKKKTNKKLKWLWLMCHIFSIALYKIRMIVCIVCLRIGAWVGAAFCFAKDSLSFPACITPSGLF